MSSRGFTSNARAGYQRHHLIPINIIRRHAFAKLFALIAQAGFNPHSFLQNGISLPASEDESAKTGLPLHRGPHRHYDELVAECLDLVWLAILAGHVPARPVAVMICISDLQGSIRRSLRPNAWITLNQNDPRRVDQPSFVFEDSIMQRDWVHMLS